MPEMNLEKFEKNKGPSGGARKVPKISIWGSDIIGINKRAINEFFEDVDWVELYYDKESGGMAIKPVEEKTGDAYKIQGKDDKGGGRITAKSFLYEYNLDRDEAESYVVEWVDKKDLVYTSLE
jgi:hypothetical protein